MYTYCTHFNFRGVKLSWISSFHVSIFADHRFWWSRIFVIFVFAPHSQPLPPRRKNLLRSGTSRCLGTKNERTDILKLPINTQTQRDNPVNAHTWGGLSNVFLAHLRFLAQRGINEDSLSIQELAVATPRCWFIKVIVRTSPFLQFVRSQLTSRSKFLRDETFADGDWSVKTAKV